MIRLWTVALILDDVEEYEKAKKRPQETVEGYKTGSRKADLRTLTGIEKLALIYEKMKQWEEAEKRFKEMIQTRNWVQGADHLDTINSMANLASMYRGQGHLEEAEKLEAMTDILKWKGDDAQIIEEEVVKIARLFDEEVMELLLDRKGNEAQITEGVVTTVAGNKSSGGEVMDPYLKSG
jgi:tetratricopeptide (TPR) repeat protein